ncbi:hypothetical protein HDE_12923 [Halotydeus destructor]|nr:hypothetical protein HDE_12923 [Halotydeus destructor]
MEPTCESKLYLLTANKQTTTLVDKTFNSKIEVIRLDQIASRSKLNTQAMVIKEYSLGNPKVPVFLLFDLNPESYATMIDIARDLLLYIFDDDFGLPLIKWAFTLSATKSSSTAKSLLSDIRNRQLFESQRMERFKWTVIPELLPGETLRYFSPVDLTKDDVLQDNFLRYQDLDSVQQKIRVKIPQSVKPTFISLSTTIGQITQPEPQTTCPRQQWVFPEIDMDVANTL